MYEGARTLVERAYLDGQIGRLEEGSTAILGIGKGWGIEHEKSRKGLQEWKERQ